MMIHRGSGATAPYLLDATMVIALSSHIYIQTKLLGELICCSSHQYTDYTQLYIYNYE